MQRFLGLIKKLLWIEDTPERTAMGFSIGVFLGFSPFSLLTSLWSPRRPGLSIRLGAHSASPPKNRPSLGLARSDRSKMSRTLRARFSFLSGPPRNAVYSP